jgi:putative lipoic acid-binding regulatory protein
LRTIAHAFSGRNRHNGEGGYVVSEDQSIQLLEAVHQFPGPYVFKVIGRVDNGFAARVVAAVRDELAGSADPPFRVRHTVGGRHVAVTLEPTVQTVHQILAVYRRIRRIPGLVMVM